MTKCITPATPEVTTALHADYAILHVAVEIGDRVVLMSPSDAKTIFHALADLFSADLAYVE